MKPRSNPADTPADIPKRGPVLKLAIVLFPLAAGAAAINIFFIGLMSQRLGIPAFTPVQSVLAGLVFGLPLTWIAARWFLRKIDEAENAP